VYKSDFEMERKSREELNDERLQLRDQVERLELELSRTQNKLAELQRQGQYNARPPAYGTLHGFPGGAAAGGGGAGTGNGTVRAGAAIIHEETEIPNTAPTPAVAAPVALPLTEVPKLFVICFRVTKSFRAN